MDFLGIGFWELILIFIVAMMVFGPRRLPEIAAKAGKIVRDLRGMSTGLLAEWQREITVAARLDELQKVRDELEEAKNEIVQAKQEIGTVQKEVSTQAKGDLQDIKQTIETQTSEAQTSIMQTSSKEEAPSETASQENTTTKKSTSVSKDIPSNTDNEKPLSDTPSVVEEEFGVNETPQPDTDALQEKTPPAVSQKENDTAMAESEAVQTQADDASRKAQTPEPNGNSVSPSETKAKSSVPADASPSVMPSSPKEVLNE